MKMKKIQKRGITIVTLVITIIILVLLTGAVMLTMNNSDIFGQTINTVDEHNKQAIIEQINLEIETEMIKKVNEIGRYQELSKEETINIIEKYGTYEEDTLKLTTAEKNIPIYLYEIVGIQVEEYVTATYRDKVFTITENESLSSNGYKYEYTYDNGVVWQTYTAPVTIEEQSGIKVRLTNSEGQVISNEYVVTKGAGEETVNKIKQIAITNAPTKTTYVQGQTFNPEGMQITVTYEDNTSKVVTNYNYTPTRALTVTDRYVTISYTENGVTKQTTQSITVTNNLTGIAILTEPTRTEYRQGESFDKAGMVVRALYEDNTSKQITNYTVTPTILTSSDTIVTITYQEGNIIQTATQNIKVAYLEAIEVTQEPAKVTYIKGENFDKTEMTISAIYKYADGASYGLPVENYQIINGTNLQEGTIEIVIRYEEGGIEKETKQVVTVTNNITGITVTTLPDKTTYNHGEEFDKIGMVVTVTYQNNETKELEESEYTVSTPTYGQNYVTITHTETGMTTTQAVTVNRVIASIEVETPPTKTEYTVEETFSIEGMVIIATYTDGGTEIVTSSCEFSPNTSTALKINNTSITITHTETGMITTQAITVSLPTNWTVANLNPNQQYVNEIIDNTIYYAPIPLGFSVVEGTNISTGLVIQDSSANQFVWVPVNESYTMKGDVTGDGTFNNATTAAPWIYDVPYLSNDTTTALAYWQASANGYTGTITDVGTYSEPYSSAGSWETAEYQAMVTSVLKYGGFYVGRYETGGSASAPVVKSGATPITSIKWNSTNTMTVEPTSGTATYVARNMYPSTSTTYGVASTLIYGIQWDSIMCWASCYNATTPYTGSVGSTGSVSTDCYKNIYDLAGNVREWSMEAMDTSYRVSRGDYWYSSHTVSSRFSYSYPGTPSNHIGFRTALYVK